MASTHKRRAPEEPASEEEPPFWRGATAGRAGVPFELTNTQRFLAWAADWSKTASGNGRQTRGAPARSLLLTRVPQDALPPSIWTSSPAWEVVFAASVRAQQKGHASLRPEGGEKLLVPMTESLKAAGATVVTILVLSCEPKYVNRVVFSTADTRILSMRKRPGVGVHVLVSRASELSLQVILNDAGIRALEQGVFVESFQFMILGAMGEFGGPRYRPKRGGGDSSHPRLGRVSDVQHSGPPEADEGSADNDNRSAAVQVALSPCHGSLVRMPLS